METRSTFFNDVGISLNESIKTMFVNLLIFENEQIIECLAQLMTNCFQISPKVDVRADMGFTTLKVSGERGDSSQSMRGAGPIAWGLRFGLIQNI